MVTYGEAEVAHRDDDGHPVFGHQEPNQPCLKNICGEEGEKHNNQGKHKTHILDTETKKMLTMTIINLCIEVTELTQI